MNIAPPGQNVVEMRSGGTVTPVKARVDWFNWSVSLTNAINDLRSSGTTANRPTERLFAGRTYFDTTLGHPIWYDGTGWVDATGASV